MPAKTKTKTKSTADKIVIYDDGEGNWWWNAVAGNNKVVAKSPEGYVNRMYARKVAQQENPGLPIEWH